MYKNFTPPIHVIKELIQKVKKQKNVNKGENKIERDTKRKLEK